MPPRGLPRRPFFPSLHSDRMARAAVRAALRLVFEHRPCVKQPGDDDGREPLELRCLRARLAGCQVKNESTGQMLNFLHRTASFTLFHFPSKGLKVVSAPPHFRSRQPDSRGGFTDAPSLPAQEEEILPRETRQGRDRVRWTRGPSLCPDPPVVGSQVPPLSPGPPGKTSLPKGESGRCQVAPRPRP